jgi:hypothetical protein
MTYTLTFDEEGNEEYVVQNETNEINDSVLDINAIMFKSFSIKPNPLLDEDLYKENEN